MAEFRVREVTAYEKGLGLCEDAKCIASPRYFIDGVPYCGKHAGSIALRKLAVLPALR